MFKPLLIRWRANGIASIVFYDDGIIGSESYEACKKASNFVYTDLVKSNVLPNPSKSQWEPCLKIEWLGFEWDLEQGGVRVTEARLQKFLHRLNILKNIFPKVTARTVAKVVGSMISMHLVLGDQVMLRTHCLQAVINYKHYMELGWDRPIHLNEIQLEKTVMTEILFLESKIVDLNFRSFFPKIQLRQLMFVDASDFAIGGTWESLNGVLTFNSDLPDDLIDKSSAERELFAIRSLIQTFADQLKGQAVLLHTDSQVAEIVCRKGSSKPYLHRYALDIFELCKTVNLDLCVIWISRDLNDDADHLSKNSDTDSWTTRPRFFEKIKTLSGLDFSLDAFANDQNAKCQKFYSLHYCPNSAGVDSLKFSWEGQVVWACPPPKLLVQTVCHFKNCKVKGVVILPEWKSLAVWPLLQSPVFARHIVRSWSFPGYLYLKSNDKKCIFNEKFRGSLKVCFFDFTF